MTMRRAQADQWAREVLHRGCSPPRLGAGDTRHAAYDRLSSSRVCHGLAGDSRGVCAFLIAADQDLRFRHGAHWCRLRGR